MDLGLLRRKLATWGETINLSQTNENLLQYSEANNVEILGTPRADRNTPIAQSEQEKCGVSQAGTVTAVHSRVKSW